MGSSGLLLNCCGCEVKKMKKFINYKVGVIGVTAK